MTSRVFDGRAGSHAKLSRGTARHSVPGKLSLTNVAAARRQKKLLFTVPFWWVGWSSGAVRYQIQIPRFAREKTAFFFFCRKWQTKKKTIKWQTKKQTFPSFATLVKYPPPRPCGTLRSAPGPMTALDCWTD